VSTQKDIGHRAATKHSGAADHALFRIEFPGLASGVPVDLGHGTDKNIGHIVLASKDIGHLMAFKDIGHLVGLDGDSEHVALKDIGHAHVSWVPAAAPAIPPPARRPVTALQLGRRPVIALLDTAVEPHPGLPAYDPVDPFYVEVDWRPSSTLAPTDDAGSHRGHGTFNAGLISRHAADAQVLAMALLNRSGTASEPAVIEAVDWLTSEIDAHRVTVDVVCMPFSRDDESADDTQGDTQEGPLRDAITRLAQRGVRIVAAAARSGSPAYPAEFAAEPGSPVIAVGSGTSAQPDSFSANTEWVRQFETGSDVVSTLPVTTDQSTPSGYVRWSGTSFAAVIHAAKLAQRLSDTAPSATGPH
jgi:hypothetical protein